MEISQKLEFFPDAGGKEATVEKNIDILCPVYNILKQIVSLLKASPFPCSRREESMNKNKEAGS